MGKIYFMTQGYNAEKTLARCVDSVLGQTKYGENIEYWFCDNGSTDKTREMLEEYAKNDSRLKLFYNEENHKWNEQSSVFWDLPQLLKEDDYLCLIDADDEYKPDFLEKMLPFLLENDLDLAMGGNDFIDVDSGEVISTRVMPQIIMIDKPERFSEYFPVYHQFARTYWGKIFTGKIANHMITRNNCPPEIWGNLKNGSDTYMVFSVLTHCKRMGLYPKAFYNYYLESNSLSRKWRSGRFNSNIILNEVAEDFLKRFGPISENNLKFLSRVFANAISDSLAVLDKAQEMTAEEKLGELRRAVDYRATSDMMRFDDDDIARCRRNIFNAALSFGLRLKRENEDFRAALTLICPDCAPFVEVDELSLYAREGALQDALFNDDAEKLIDQLLNLISKGSYQKQFDLHKIVERFSAGRGLAEEISGNSDKEFIKKHSRIFFLIWQRKYIQALDKMTGQLQDKGSVGEMFFQVYLTLAAMLESVDEFVFGKVKLAAYYCDHDQSEECRTALDDLADMGVEDNDEITEIKAKLNSK